MIDRRLPMLAILVTACALACSTTTPAPPRAAPRPPVPVAPTEPAPAPPEAESTPAEPEVTQLRVTATAYNSLPSQGVGRGTHGAWGDRLKPGTKTIAVSRDLLALGLTRGVEVEIVGLPGRYTVMDRLPSRWSRRIDIYMGTDVRAARRWGRRDVQIRWDHPPDAPASLD